MRILPNDPASVLIVDDELGRRDSIRAVLEHRFRVTTAESGEQALELLRHRPADVVTLDLAMPGLGGLKTFRMIRELDPDVEIIVLSGERSLFERIAHGLSHEASAWIAEPFDPAQLVQAVERAAERSRIGRVQAEALRASTVPGLHGRAPEVTMNFLRAEESDGGLNQIAAHAMEDAKPGAQLKRIELRADLDSNLPWVSLDVALIARIVRTIAVDAAATEKAVAVVADEHESIPPSRREDLARMFSHDIKNRLNVVLGYVDLLRGYGQEEVDSQEGLQALDAIESSAHDALSLAVNFLHVEDSDGGELRIHKTPASLTEIVRQVMKDEASRARLKRIDLQVDLDSGFASMNLDVGMITRALTNLVDNALRFSPVGGVVRIEARYFDTKAILRVIDSGPGIPADQVSRLFKRHGRGPGVTTGDSTGFGLYLVKTIAEAHGGSVAVTFPPDGGSAFVIVLPRSPDGDA
jgi:signal transduction histidine kinase